jgi:tetratricopeptide (TPR) repeat protein
LGGKKDISPKNSKQLKKAFVNSNICELFHEGIYLINNCDFEEADLHFDKLINKITNTSVKSNLDLKSLLSNAYTQKAIILYKRLEDPKGENILKYLDQALALDPKNLSAVRVRENILFGRGELPSNQIIFE